MALLLCTAAAGSMLTETMLAFFRPEAPAKVPNRTLTFAHRVAYQRAIEEVYWRHRIWPKERPDPKPSLDEIIPPAQLEKKTRIAPAFATLRRGRRIITNRLINWCELVKLVSGNGVTSGSYSALRTCVV